MTAEQWLADLEAKAAEASLAEKQGLVCGWWDIAEFREATMEDARCIYAHLWDTLYAACRLGWSVNPLVWVVTFKRVEDKS